MLAKAYIERYVHPDYRAYARVIVSSALKGTHTPLKPDQPVPDTDSRNVSVFLLMDTDAMPPVLILDHNCDEMGFICKDHPEQFAGHDGCYGKPIACAYPGCGVQPSASGSGVFNGVLSNQG